MLEQSLNGAGWTNSTIYTSGVNVGFVNQPFAPLSSVLHNLSVTINGTLLNAAPYVSLSSSLWGPLVNAFSPAQMQASEALRDYARWYASYVAAYEEDLRAKGEEDPEGLRYAADIGLPRLTYLWPAQLHVVTSLQAGQVQSVLHGFRGLAELSTDIAGRAEWIVEAVEAAEEQLRRLGLLVPGLFASVNDVASVPVSTVGVYTHQAQDVQYPEIRPSEPAEPVPALAA